MVKGIVTMVSEELKRDKALDHLRKENLKMRLELEVISTHPNGKAARKIIEKYRQMKKVRREQNVAIQN